MKRLTTKDVARLFRVPVQRIYQLIMDLETVRGINVQRIRHRIQWNDELLEAVENEAIRRGWIVAPVLTKKNAGQE